MWILLLPLRCCCCPLGCVVQLLWNAVEWLLKAPLRAMLWASGKPWKPGPPLQMGGAQGSAAPGKDKTPPV